MLALFKLSVTIFLMNKGLIAAVIVVFLAYIVTRGILSGIPASNPQDLTQSSNSAMLETNQESVETWQVNYFEDSLGFLAKPKAAGSYPGVVMIHEWWGLNDNIKDMAKQLANEGYFVFAVDLYDGKVAKDAQDAGQMTAALDQEKALANMKAAYTYLKNQGVPKVASLGWCFGGGQSMQLALSGEPFDATVIYYGNLETDKNKLANINWPVLGVFGDQDQTIAVGTVNEFDKALDTLNIENEIYIYPGVGHAFANPTGQAYAPEETRDAWGKTVAFLNKHLKT